MREKVAAWELDTVSQGMLRVWTRENQRLSPREMYLVAVVLENGAFKKIDFAKANLSLAVLYDACFQDASLRQANLTNASLLQVDLRGADLSGIENFEGSSWQNSNWWDARNAPPRLIAYLQSKYPRESQNFQPRCMGEN